MGRAIAEYWKTNKADRLRMFSPMFEEDEIPLTTLFRSYEDMPEYRHQGLGTLVVQEAEKWAKELGFTTTVLESRDNKIHFYETMGYVADYSQKIVGETFTCYRMEKQLK